MQVKMSFLTTGVQEILEALDASLLEAVQQASCMYCYHAWLSQSLWSDGTPDAVSHSLGQVSGAADQVERMHSWGGMEDMEVED